MGFGADGEQLSGFASDRHRFFSFFANTKPSAKTLDDIVNRARDKVDSSVPNKEGSLIKHDYGFIAPVKEHIRANYDLSFDWLNKQEQNGVDKDILAVFWSNLYDLCISLQKYHFYYGQNEVAAKYKKLRAQIRKRIIALQKNYKESTPIHKDSFFVHLAKTTTEDLVDLAKTPMHSSKIKARGGFVNLVRIYWIFCRLVITKSLLLAGDFKWIDKLGHFLGKKIDVDRIISILEKPSKVLRAYSVGFFVFRLLINVVSLVKHVFFPSIGEKDLDLKKRLADEIYKRHGDLINDTAWGTANLLTNYNNLFHISAPVAGWIVAGFLFFDVCLIFWRRHLAEKEYIEIRRQFCDDLKYYQEELRNQDNAKASPKERGIWLEQTFLLEEQIKQWDIRWEAKNSTYWFNASAAFLLMVGFSASMIFSPPIIILACYMLCTFAVAMYLSGDAYYNYKEKKVSYERVYLDSNNSEQAFEEYRVARNDFYLTLTKNALMPALMITTFALCWQAALVLAAVYISYQLYDAYNKHEENKNLETQIVVTEEDINMESDIGLSP